MQVLIINDLLNMSARNSAGEQRYISNNRNLI